MELKITIPTSKVVLVGNAFRAVFDADEKFQGTDKELVESEILNFIKSKVERHEKRLHVENFSPTDIENE